LRQHEQQLKTLGVEVSIVTFEAGPLATAYVRETQLQWPLLVDNERVLYQAYGMERGSSWDIFGPTSMWAHLKLLGRGRRMQPPGSDIHQLGGDVLINPHGLVQIHHVGSGPADRPTISALLKAIRE